MDPSVLTLLERLYRFGQDNDAQITERPKRMLNITSDTGRLLWILVRLAHAKRILEVGTSNGFSTIWLADAARATGGRVTTLEVNPDKVVMARKNLVQAGVADLVDIREGRAAETLAALSGPFDVAFLDADRPSYATYLELVVPKLSVPGLLVADNVTSHRIELEDYLTRVKSDPRLFSVTVPVGNGEEISLRLS
jgi:predicted O-methyltransferase YrrM